MEIQKINLEQHSLTVDEALATVETEIQALKINPNIKMLKIIHGYGSKGVGGKIKEALPQVLNKLKTQKKIEWWVNNSNFGVLSNKYKEYSKKYPEIILDNDLKNFNPGITIVFL